MTNDKSKEEVDSDLIDVLEAISKIKPGDKYNVKDRSTVPGNSWHTSFTRKETNEHTLNEFDRELKLAQEESKKLKGNRPHLIKLGRSLSLALNGIENLCVTYEVKYPDFVTSIMKTHEEYKIFIRSLKTKVQTPRPKQHVKKSKKKEKFVTPEESEQENDTKIIELNSNDDDEIEKTLYEIDSTFDNIEKHIDTLEKTAKRKSTKKRIKSTKKRIKSKKEVKKKPKPTVSCCFFPCK